MVASGGSEAPPPIAIASWCGWPGCGSATTGIRDNRRREGFDDAFAELINNRVDTEVRALGKALPSRSRQSAGRCCRDWTNDSGRWKRCRRPIPEP